MSELFRVLGYHVYIWSNEGLPEEPIHVHVSKRPHPNATKIWINSNGKVEVQDNPDKVPNKILRRICAFLEELLNNKQTKDEWRRIFGRIRYKDRQNQR